MVFSRLVHVVACVRTSFLFVVEYCSIVWLYLRLYIHSPVDGHLDCFRHLTVRKNAAVSACVQVFEHLFSALLGVY